MLIVFLHFMFSATFLVGLKWGIYNGIVYGLIAKKIWRGTNNGLQIPYLFAGQAKCRGWGLIYTPGFAFILATLAAYSAGMLFEMKKDAGEYIALVYIEGYLIMLGYFLFGAWFVYSGYKYGIKERKIKTHYHLTDGQKYYIDNTQEKQRVASPHKYFRGTKAYKIGIVRVITGFVAILFALLLFLDRDYYAGSARESIYPNLYKLTEPWRAENKRVEEEKRLKEAQQEKLLKIDKSNDAEMLNIEHQIKAFGNNDLNISSK